MTTRQQPDGSHPPLAAVTMPRYANIMPDPLSSGNKAANPLHVPAALLRLWLLAALAMAGLYGWQGWRLLPYPGDWAAPPIPRGVSVVEGLYLFLFVPAAIVIAARWRRARDPWLAWLALAYGLASAAALLLWADAATLGDQRTLFFADALISLFGIVVAVRALRV